MTPPGFLVSAVQRVWSSYESSGSATNCEIVQAETWHVPPKHAATCLPFNRLGHQHSGLLVIDQPANDDAQCNSGKLCTHVLNVTGREASIKAEHLAGSA